nr:centrosomal protein of 72 kDa-like isoform X1 [Oncorhynchus nerka]
MWAFPDRKQLRMLGSASTKLEKYGGAVDNSNRAVDTREADVRSLSLPGSYKEKIRHLGISLKNFVRLKTLNLSCNALISVEGVQHLKRLERLNLYYNNIPSLQEVKVLWQLTALRELDLRLNPLAKTDPHYRLYFVHALSNLRRLDDCPVRDSERRASIMHFSSDSVLRPQQTSSSETDITDQRYCTLQY